MVACAGIVEADYRPVEARSLFETLFPRAAERKRQRKLERLRREQAWQREMKRRERARARKKRARTKPVRVKGPQYYTYKANPMVKAKLATLKQPLANAQLKAKAREALERDAVLREQIVDKRFSFDAVAKSAMVRPAAPLTMASFADDLDNVALMGRKPLIAALTKHYSENPQFLWLDAEGRVTGEAESVIELLAGAEAVGLDGTHYRVQRPFGRDGAALMAFELELTAAALRYFADARHGVVDPNKISGYHDFRKNVADYPAMMAQLAKADDAAVVLNSAHPRDQAFGHLKAALAAERAKGGAQLRPLVIPARTFIRPGATNDALPEIMEAIRRRASDELKTTHADTLARPYADGVYDEAAVALVRDVQKELRLKPDGIVGKNTIKRLIGKTPENRIQKIRLAMERLRWHPDTLGATHVFINQPSYRVQMIRNGRERVAMNVVVGKKANQTNFFYDQIEYVEFNPYWGVPQSIIVNEMLPKLRRDPSYLDRKGYEITDARGRYLSSWDVNWNAMGSKVPLNIRQPPGAGNALGQLKIMFPNKHSIYMHDTPAKSLFSKPVRAYSHGCVRLADPRAMAAAVLGTSVQDIGNHIARGHNHKRKLDRKMPVYVAYFTAWPNSEGNVQFFADIYDRDAYLAKAMEAELKVRQQALES